MLKVLVVDDSALMRRRIGDILSSAGFEVETAADGAEALERLSGFDPDVVTLDVTMPGMDGLACLKRIMIEHPKPVVMVSALTADGAEVTLEALRLGAVEAVRKPTGVGAIAGIAEELVDTVRAAAGSRPRRVQGLRERLRRARERIVGEDFLADVPRSKPQTVADSDGDPSEGLVLIGVSTGGPRTLEDILPLLPTDFPWPVVVAQHMPASFTGPLARRLDIISAVTVVEAAAATALQPGMACIARGGADLQIVRRGGRLCAQPVPADERRNWHPNVDRLVESALRAIAPSRLIGVLLTGMGSDGAASMTELRRQGGRTIAEAEASAVVFGMPQELIRRGGADMVLPSDRVAQQVTRWVRG
ncbi:chemotaxis-specific protein-glutamate methyltransferase CheB [Azospirillum brasilense]|uniref:Protein-glutamate methylesterase/protein-glutamine glutaminase n=1 Tax=Azospirillum brasilense TaxID=192 RepID=A0A0P0EHD9_AZOBR|nr:MULTISPECIES: chemotaxis-specific protein-glutamate methyltransferase CheB [Azospirillum]ALJ38476.1 two-component system response regulator protein-glutamate methylesterase [Azospirillum brasilense]MDW7553127.1 chemotaxis-specific protein-glutamate methyltransferase CheB [Azospirillum brasilense]MDW7593495.1 chemotaxis-specific protein-glutamate methyltransferase CheB [Azospirillum brasilense]MDW7628446.1 chemotaxis-specific protein-glutamate methyltransferase CheB [Azospirillum brasilense]